MRARPRLGEVATHNEASLAMAEVVRGTAIEIAMTTTIIVRRDMAVRKGCGGRTALKHSLIQSVQLHDFGCNLQLQLLQKEEEEKIINFFF